MKATTNELALLYKLPSSLWFQHFVDTDLEKIQIRKISHKMKLEVSICILVPKKTLN